MNLWKRSRLFRWSAVALGTPLALCALAAGIGGGFAHRLPPPLTPDERAILERGTLPYRISVQRGRHLIGDKTYLIPPAYTQRTFRWLTRSGTFAAVDTVPSAIDFGLVASPTGRYCNKAIIPILSWFTLGIIPTIVEDTDCEGAIFWHAVVGGPDSVVVQVANTHVSMQGLLAGPVGFLPGWTHGDPGNHPVTRDRARLAILQHRAALERLMATPRATEPIPIPRSQWPPRYRRRLASDRHHP